MTEHAVNPVVLQERVVQALGGLLQSSCVRLGELTIVVSVEDYIKAVLVLRDHADCKFEQMIDLCGVDYSTYKNQAWEGPRFCVVLHLLSVSLNQRVRLKVFVPNDDAPT
ncbi:MAG: NADH-quinone oxidoreductase subunit C, partial [Rhodoferax sp.]|nr:NADH-quinone oxidoreductase subunit C [Rhodoferax sp.]